MWSDDEAELSLSWEPTSSYAGLEVESSFANSPGSYVSAGGRGAFYSARAPLRRASDLLGQENKRLYDFCTSSCSRSN